MYKKHDFVSQWAMCVSKLPNTWKTYLTLVVLDSFLMPNYEVISSLISTCSCLYVYCFRMLPMIHMHTQMWSKTPHSDPPRSHNEYKTCMSSKVGNVCPTQERERCFVLCYVSYFFLYLPLGFRCPSAVERSFSQFTTTKHMVSDTKHDFGRLGTPRRPPGAI